MPSLHYIIHKESLCGKSKADFLRYVMERVIKILNIFCILALEHPDREAEAQYGELIYFAVGRWLAHENLLKCFNKLHYIRCFFCLFLFLNKLKGLKRQTMLSFHCCDKTYELKSIRHMKRMAKLFEEL